MGAGISSVIRVLLTEDFVRRVADAKASEQVVLATEMANELAKIYPASCLTEQQIARKIRREAARIGAAFALGNESRVSEAA